MVPKQARDQGTRSPIELFWTAKKLIGRGLDSLFPLSGHQKRCLKRVLQNDDNLGDNDDENISESLAL